MESQPQSSTGDAKSASQQLSSDAHEQNLQSEGRNNNATSSNFAGKLCFCLNDFADKA